MPPIVLVYHILILVWVRNARTCMHLASCISELVDRFVRLRVRYIKIYFDRHVVTIALLQKFIYVAMLNFNLFFLKTVAYVSAMCPYRWLTSRTWLWTLRVGHTPMPSTPATFLVCCGRCSERLTTLSPHSTQGTNLACWVLSAVR